MLLNLHKSFNKGVKQYTCLLSELYNISEGQRVYNKPNIANRKRKERRKTEALITHKRDPQEANRKHIKNPSDKDLTDDQISLVSNGLKFIPTLVTNDNLIRRQLLRDFHPDFARRIRLQYIFDRQDNEPHPFQSEPLVQPSVALESYLERVNLSSQKYIFIQSLKNNLPLAKRLIPCFKSIHSRVQSLESSPSFRLPHMAV